MTKAEQGNVSEEVVSKDISLDEPSVPEDTRHYATFSARLLASMLDSLIGMLPLVILAFFVQLSTPTVPDAILMKMSSGVALTDAEMQVAMKQLWFMFGNTIAQFVVLSAVVVVLWVYFSATPGKMLLGIEVIDDKTGGKLGVWQSIWRIIGYIVSSLPFMMGFFWMHIDKKNRCWHDKMAGTVVVYTENSIYYRVATKYARLLSGRKE